MSEQQPPERKGSAFEDGLEIKIANDKMRATVDLDVRNIDKWSPKRVTQELAQAGVLFGVDQTKIAQLFEQKLFNQPLDVAVGIRPQDGQDGYIQYHVDISRVRGKPKDLGNGRVDLKDLGVFIVIAKDQLLAELIDPTEGQAGKDVFGTEMPAKAGKEVKLAGGKGTRLSEDGKKLYADLDGILEGDKNKLEVNPALVVKGDVSYETGNIDSNVAVVVNGNVLSGFTIRSTEDICVAGVVEAATIESDKSITINAGIQGDGRAVLKAKGAISANFANESTLIANEGIYLRGGLTHCIVDTNGVIECEGDRGVIVGGEVRAGVEVSATVIGSELGAKTVLEVGPDVQAMEQELRDIQQQRETLANNQAKLQQVLMVIQQARKAGKQLPARQLAMAQQALKAHADISKKAQEMAVVAKQMEERIVKERAIQRFVHAKQVIWPGLQVRILNQRMTVKHPIQACTLAVVDREIQTFAYRGKTQGSEKEKSDSGKDKQSNPSPKN